MTWYCLRCRHVDRVRTRLIADGVETYVPMIKRTRRVSRHVRGKKGYVDELVPMFPGYVFVRDPDLSVLRRSRWVIGFVGTRDGPYSVRDGVIDSLRARDYGSDKVGLVSGVDVLITSGPFAELRGVVEAIMARDQVKVVVDGRYNVLVSRESLAY